MAVILKQKCPTCQAMVPFTEKEVGKKIECPKCKDRFVVETHVNEVQGSVTTIEPDLPPVRRQVRDDTNDAHRSVPTKTWWEKNRVPALIVLAGSVVLLIALALILRGDSGSATFQEKAARIEGELAAARATIDDLRAKAGQHESAESLKKRMDGWQKLVGEAKEEIRKEHLKIAADRAALEKEKQEFLAIKGIPKKQD